MKRVGKRAVRASSSKISWEEALDTIASNMQQLIKEYGNESIYLNSRHRHARRDADPLLAAGENADCPSDELLRWLSLNHYGDYSSAQIAAGLNYTYGGWADGNSPSDIENSQLVVLFGNNPGETRMSGGGVTYLEQARRNPMPG